MNLTRENIDSMLAEEVIIDTFLNRAEKLLYQVMSKYRNQKDAYVCESLNMFDNDSLRMLSSFGIIGRGTSYFSERKYVLVLDEKDISNLQVSISNFMADNFPEGESPLYLILTFKVNNAQLTEILDRIRNLTGFDLNAIINRDRKEEHYLLAKKKLDEELSAYVNLTKVDISDIINDLAKSKYGVCREDFIAKFDFAYRKILSMTTSKELITYSDYVNCNDDSRDIYIMMASMLTYFDNRKVYIFKDIYNLYINCIHSMCLDVDRYLKEDYLSYLKYLPDALVRYNEYGSYICDIINHKTEVTLRYVDLSMKSKEVINRKVDLSSIEIHKIGDFFEFNTLNKEVIKESKARLSEKINELSKLLEEDLNAYDILIFSDIKDRDKIYIGHVVDVDFSAYVWYFPLQDDRPWFRDTLDLQMLNKLIPVSFFTDGVPLVKEINNKIKVLASQYPAGDERRNAFARAIIKNIKPYVFNYKYGIIFDYVPFDSKSDFTKLDCLSYLTLVQYHPFQQSFRGIVRKTLEEIIPKQNLMEQGILDIFDGMDPLFKNTIRLSEMTIRREMKLED